MFKTDNLYQNDPQWKDTLLGFSTSVTIGKWGCLLTSATMVVNGLGFKETPQTMNEKMRGVGGFNGAAFFPAYVPAAFPGVVYSDYIDCEKVPAPLDRIDSALAAGKPVIVCVDWNRDAGIQTHWVVLKEKKNNNYTMYDPYRYSGDGPTKELILTDRYKFQGTDPSKAILAVIFFDSQNVKPVEAPEPVKVPADAVTVYVTEDGLSMRAEPTVAAFRYKTLSLNTALTSLEPKATVLLKVGVSGQWLQVQDPDGQQGYVAAWYLSASKIESKPDSTAFEKPAAKVTVPADSIKVYVNEEGLSFRSAANINSERLNTFALKTPLASLESASVTRSKLGVVGQWLRVQDPSGQQGYVAAWYVVETISAPTEAPQPKPAATSTPASQPSTTVTPTENNVMFRTKPVISPETQIRLLAGTETLTVLDPPAEAAAKLGMQGEWMHVRDAQKVEGYVAAWYLKAIPAAGQPASPSAPAGPVTARTTGDQVALRSKPVVADDTLIKRLAQGAVVTLSDQADAVKIGQQNQWIKVKDNQGAEGYIAAWYLAR